MLKGKLFNYFRNGVTYLLAGFFPLVKRLFPFPDVRSIDETLDEVISKRKSISRYGDGEFLYILDRKDLPFQDFDSRLAAKLMQVLQSDNPDILIALPIGFNNMRQLTGEGQLFWKSRIVWMYPRLRKILRKNKVYYNAHMSRIYFDLRDKSDSVRYFQKIVQLWQGRDIVIIEGEKSRLGLGNDLFQGSNSIRRIVGPAHHAFSQFDEIKSYVVENISKDALILLAMGPTATVLSFELAEAGFQSVDIGNIDIEYEWYLRHTTEKIKIPYKYTGEAKGGREVASTNDTLYHSQIIASFAPDIKTDIKIADFKTQSKAASEVEIGWLMYATDPVKRSRMLAWEKALHIKKSYRVNNHPTLRLEDEWPGTNINYEFSAYEHLCDAFTGPGPYILVNDTLFRNHGHHGWLKLVKLALKRPGSYPLIWGDWRSENFSFPEKPMKYLASWIFVIPDRQSLEAFSACLKYIIHHPLPAATKEYETYISGWLQPQKLFSGWHGPSDALTLKRKKRTVRLEHALSKEMPNFGLTYLSIGEHQPVFYNWIRLYDRLRTRWMAIFHPDKVNLVVESGSELNKE